MNLFICYFSADEEEEYANCTDGQIRLLGGSTPLEGRAELCHNNLWFGLCPTYQSINNYNAICKQLGYLGQSKISHLPDYYKIKFNKDARSSLDPFFKLPVVPYYHKQFLCTQNDGNFNNCRTAPTPCPPQNNVYLHLKCQGIIIIIKVYTCKSKFFYSREMQK